MLFLMLQNVAWRCIMDIRELRGKGAMKEEYFTVEEVAKKIHLSEYRIRQLIREKHIKAVKIGRWRVYPEDLERFIKSRSNL